MKSLLILILSLFCLAGVKAQNGMTTVRLDLIQNRLNGGMPLPSEEQFYISGAIPEDIDYVSLLVYPAGKKSKTGVNYFWKAPFSYQNLEFQVLVEDPLRSNSEYVLEFGFYRPAGASQIEELRELLHSNLESYLSLVTTVNNNGIEFSESKEDILKDLNEIVSVGAKYFVLPNGTPFPGFSDLTGKKLDQGKSLKLRKAKFIISKKNREGNEQRIAYAKQYLEELQTLVFSEVDQYLTPSMLVLVDNTVFNNSKTEQKPYSIPINVGYGAISLTKNLPNQEFLYSPYVGFSFPLGNRTFNKFMSNLSVSTGVFLFSDLENSLGETITGPAIDRPVYVGLGYNFFRVIRLNAGGTFLTTEGATGTNTNSFQPFVGLSAEIRFWLGFGNRR